MTGSFTFFNLADIAYPPGGYTEPYNSTGIEWLINLAMVVIPIVLLAALIIVLIVMSIRKKEAAKAASPAQTEQRVPEGYDPVSGNNG